MKNLFFALMLIASFVVASCAPSPQKIAEKIANGETLSSAEYTEALDYSQKMVKVINDSIAAHKGDFRGIIHAMQNISRENPEANMIVENLLSVDPSTLDEKNQKLRDELLKSMLEIKETLSQEGPIMTTGSFDKAMAGHSDNAVEEVEKEELTISRELKADSVAQLTPDMKETNAPANAESK